MASMSLLVGAGALVREILEVSRVSWVVVVVRVDISGRGISRGRMGM